MQSTQQLKQDLLIHAGTALMGTYARLFLKLDIRTLAPLPPGPKIFACNHPTTTDPLLISTLTGEPVRILVTGGAFLVPVFKDYLSGAGHIPIHRGEGRGGEIVAQAVKTLNAGKSVCIFPEGGLSPDEGARFGVAPAHSGVGRIALASGAPVVPIGVAVDKESLTHIYKEVSFSEVPAVGRWAGRGPYAVTIGVPLAFPGDPHDRGTVNGVGERVTEEIRHLTALSRIRIPRRSAGFFSLARLRTILFSFMKQITA
jgi:1-acyl-sn-glycerol-3-phosphate acyltransferase